MLMLPMNTQQEHTRRCRRTKTYECNECGLVNKTKEEKWKHIRIHIPKEKMHACIRCHFVTRYKHHLLYHIGSHLRLKPFKCTVCEYPCANNAMLKSHMK